MKIAVVGGGVFGSSAAWMLARAGHTVHLYEKRPDIFQGASGINQYRLHRGYHYPRSKETALLSLAGEKSFRKEYASSVLEDSVDHYYCVAAEGSFTSPEKCMEVWDEIGLEYEEVGLDLMRLEQVAATFRVKEFLFNPHVLKELCQERMRQFGVKVILGKEATKELLNHYDQVVVATYAHNNHFIEKSAHKEYQFELCEKVVLDLPREYKGKSIVVIDGPFMCIDPYGTTGLFVMGNVEHAIHSRSIGSLPSIPDDYLPYLNNGIIKEPQLTRIHDFIHSAGWFFKGIDKAKHVGSMFTIRTVQPYREHDDARPTVVEKINDRLITVFSGKIPTCIDAAEQVVQAVNGVSSNTASVISSSVASEIRKA